MMLLHVLITMPKTGYQMHMLQLQHAHVLWETLLVENLLLPNVLEVTYETFTMVNQKTPKDNYQLSKDKNAMVGYAPQHTFLGFTKISWNGCTKSTSTLINIVVVREVLHLDSLGMV
jgi:hypothetical protein